MADMKNFLVVMEEELHASDVIDIKYLLKDTLSGKLWSYILRFFCNYRC